MRSVRGWAIRAANEPLTPWQFERRDLLPRDVAVQITHCGVCGSDLSAWRNDASDAPLPLVPGHEIAGVVTQVGADVTRFTVGDAVLVGTIVDSCRTCPPCLAGEESYCVRGVTTTYGGQDRRGTGVTQGGYSTDLVADERFVYLLPQGLAPEQTAPLMCAGATTWSPLMHWDAGPETVVGVVGLGGLGHMAVKWSHALGAETVLFTTNPDKADEGRRLGADDVIVSRDGDQMKAAAGRFDLILDTAAGSHLLDPYLQTLRLNGVLCQLGIPGGTLAIEQMSLLLNRRSLTSSAVCGTPETQRMLDFAGRHGIGAEVDVLPGDQVNAALTRLADNDVRYRLVLEMSPQRSAP